MFNTVHINCLYMQPPVIYREIEDDDAQVETTLNVLSVNLNLNREHP